MWPFTSWTASTRVNDAIAKKRSERSAAIQAGLRAAGNSDDSDPDSRYIQADVAEIASNIRQRRWTAQRVMQAYVRAAARAHDRTNCLTEPLFVQALEEARQLDARLAQDPDNASDDHLLLGVPVSLKDQINVKGIDSTIGFARYTDEPADEDALISTLLKSQGAIPFCKTNVPQTMLAFECSNPLFGRTLNPYSPNHVPGGSSGGEAALLASNGSPFGIGSDIGGSLRIPAHYSGCYALKPVYGRWPSAGCRGPVPGYEAIRTTLGPMARSIEALELGCRAVISAAQSLKIHETQASMLPVPWRSVELKKKLRFGYFIEDGLVRTSPACARAVTETIQALTAAGHECLPIDIPAIPEALRIFQALSSSDGYSTLLSHILPSEDTEPALFLATLGPKLPAWFRSTVAWLLERVAGERIMASFVRVSCVKPMKDVLQWQKRRNDYVERVRSLLWKELELDAVISPVQASPAVTHGATKRLSPLCLQTVLWNVVDSTVGVIPITRVDPAKDALPESFASQIQQAGSRLLSKFYYKEVYNPTAMANLPLGVQIVGPAYEDERIIETMKIVEAAVRARSGSSFKIADGLTTDRVY